MGKNLGNVSGHVTNSNQSNFCIFEENKLNAVIAADLAMPSDSRFSTSTLQKLEPLP